MRINKFSTAAAICVIAAQMSFSQTKKPVLTKKPIPSQTKKMLSTSTEKLSYAIGLSIAQNIKQQGIGDSIKASLLNQAISDVLSNKKPLMTAEEAQNAIQTFFAAQQAKNAPEQSKAAEKNAAEGRAFLAENKKRSTVVELPSGLQYEVIKEGTGDMPKASDEVTTHYHGTLINGDVFDSSVDRGQPATFPVGGVIPAWVEALQLMKTGSKWKLYCPSNLAYGSQGAGGKIGPNTTLIFEVELISIAKK